ncbi:MAG: type II toxin-antitoxin system Phd/YefM family antitoxin [Acidimicrobiales bacterium]
METTVGIRELKAKLSEYVRRASEGEEILVTEHGRPLARITPASPDLAEVLGRPRVGNGHLTREDVLAAIEEGRAGRR